MKYLLIGSVLALAACATPPQDNLQSLGNSQHAPSMVARCIAANWANNSGKTVYLQHTLAGDRAFDVYVPGQQAPGGAAAVVRPDGPGSWVGFRGDGGSAAGSVNTCL